MGDWIKWLIAAAFRSLDTIDIKKQSLTYLQLHVRSENDSLTEPVCISKLKLKKRKKQKKIVSFFLINFELN